MIAWSFTAVPPGGAAMSGPAVGLLMSLGSTMFRLALGFAMPVIVIVFAINMSLAMVARAVPQINIFMESFPLRIIAGLAVVMFGLGAMASMWTTLFEDMERSMARFVQLLGS
jgi:flagellar biosynthetic protein FliR